MDLMLEAEAEQYRYISFWIEAACTSIYIVKFHFYFHQ